MFEVHDCFVVCWWFGFWFGLTVLGGLWLALLFDCCLLGASRVGVCALLRWVFWA